MTEYGLLVWCCAAALVQPACLPTAHVAYDQMSQLSALAVHMTGSIYIARTSATAECAPLTLVLVLQVWAACLFPLQVMYMTEARGKVSLLRSAPWQPLASAQLPYPKLCGICHLHAAAQCMLCVDPPVHHELMAQGSLHARGVAFWVSGRVNVCCN